MSDEKLAIQFYEACKKELISSSLPLNGLEVWKRNFGESGDVDVDRKSAVYAIGVTVERGLILTEIGPALRIINVL